MTRKRTHKRLRTRKRGNQARKAKANRNIKDTVFCKLFNDEQKLIELYNTLEGTHFGPETKIEITTLEDVLFIDKKNDLSFIIDNRFIVFAEHQSTIAPNIPLRFTVYAGRNFENMIEGKEIYREKPITIPAPAFYLFYCGEKNWDVKTLRLSASYIDEPPENSMELVVKVINLSYNIDNEILQKNETLRGYSKLITYIKEGLKTGMIKEDAIKSAVKCCKSEGYLVEFLEKYGQEINSMLFEEVTLEDVIEIREEDAYEKGHETGLKKGLEKGKSEEREVGIQALLNTCKRFNISRKDALTSLVQEFSLEESAAEEYLKKYWK